MPGSPAVASRPVTAYLADAAIPVAMLVAMVAVVVPLPPTVIDLLLAANLTAAVIALLAAIAARTPLEMAVFPTFLLGATLVRLVLNIATTRLILTRAAVDGEAAAGQVVEAFGGFVSGNSLAVGAVIFAIIAVVQLVVITAGASRTSEVAARFTLDAMPGRQMAIDAELKAGSITAAEARRLRNELQGRSDFFSSMDGASRFVRGEAIAGVVITMINLAGGIAIGTLQHGMPIDRAGQVFSKLTIGDGLVTAASSLLISVSMGLLISRSSHAADLSRELGRQFGGKPKVLATAAVFLAALSLTGLPFLPLVSVAAVLAVIAWRQRHAASPVAEDVADTAPPERLMTQLLGDEAVSVELGRDLLYLVAGPAPVLPARTTALRGSLAADLGIVLPKVVFRDSMDAASRWCRIQIAGEVLYEDILPAGRVLAVGGELSPFDDEYAVVDPLSHASSRWIAAREVATARQRGSQLHDTADVVMRALEGAVRRRAELLLTRDAVARLIESVRQSQPAVVDGVVPELLPLKLVHRTLQQLVREGVPIRPLPALLEIMADHAGDTAEPEQLAEWVRRGLSRTICRRARDGAGRLPTVRLTGQAIADLQSHLQNTQESSFDERQLMSEIRRAVRPGLQRGSPPVLVVPASLRRRVRSMLANDLPDVPVLSIEETADEARVEIFATVGDRGYPRASAA
jgi:flagellar biosynthesis protein FlhA